MSEETLLKLIRFDEVRNRVAESTSTIYEKIAAGTFPRPVPLGPKSRAWVESEINDYIRSKIAARDGRAA